MQTKKGLQNKDWIQILKTWEDSKIDIVGQKADAKDKQERNQNIDAKLDIKL